jgi:acylphosphatase
MSVDPAIEDSTEGVAFRVTGKVQGVFYRVFGRNAAEALELRGWIRNEPDGSVTGAAFGSAQELRRFLGRLRQGPPAGRVEDLTWQPVSGASAPDGFEIRY